MRSLGTSPIRKNRRSPFGRLASVVLGLWLAPNLSAQVVYSYDNNSVLAIADNTGCASFSEHSYLVADSFTVGDIAVGVDIDHTWRGDLRLILVAPDGSSITLPNETANDNGDNYRVMFSSNAEGIRNDGDVDPPANAPFRRLVNANNINFYTGNAQGTWRLRVCDLAAQDIGTLNASRLVLRDAAATAPTICGSNLTYDWGANGNNQPFVSASGFGVTMSQGATSGEAPSDGDIGVPSFITRTGTNGNHAGYYSLNMDTAGDTELSVEHSTFNFSEPVSSLTLTMLDVDKSNGNGWEDYLRVEGFDSGGNAVPRQIVAANAQLQFAGDWLEADLSAAPNNTDGNFTVSFTRAVSSVRITYAQGDQPQTNSVFQIVGVSDFFFCVFDYGDAPASYSTADASGTVARHVLADRNRFLGTAPDGEADGSPGPNADGDGADEDGVTFPTKISPVGLPQFWRCGSYDTSIGEYCVSVSASNGTGTDAQLVGWVDFNADGDFLDANERSLPALAQAAGGAADATFITGNVPSGFSGTRILRWIGITNATLATTYLRVRLTSDPGFFSDASPQPTGQLRDGEMEDHLIPANTLPVRLMQVQSERVDGRLSVRFTSASEVANVGYSIEEMVAGALKPLAPNLLASAAVDSAEVNDYQITLDRAPESGNFYIVDHDTHGGRNLRGPFLVGASYGAKPVLTVPHWSQVRAELAMVSERNQATTAAAKAGRLWVTEPGFYRVGAAMLAAAGVDLIGTPVADIAVTFRGEGVPRRIASAGATFDSASTIDFLVAPGYSLYTAELPYLIGSDGVGVIAIGDLPRVATITRPAWYWERTRYAPERWYNIGSPGIDPWQADRLLAFSTQAASVDLGLTTSAVATTDFAARLSAELIGVTNWPGAGQDHRVTLSVNGSLRGTAVFDGGRAETLAVLLPDLASGNQSIRIEADGQTGFAYDLVNLDAVELHYPRLPVASAGRLYMQQTNADASDGLASGSDQESSSGALFAADFEGEFTPPGFVASGFADGELIAYAGGGRDWRALGAVSSASGGAVTVPLIAGASDYFIANVAALPAPRVEALPVAAALPVGPTDYLIISHGNFIAAMAPLVALQESRGLTTQVVAVEQIFLQFGHGLPEGAAIQSYLKAAVAALGVRYVLLVGADTYDYKDYLGLGSVSLVPTLYQSLGNGIRYAPTDNALADFNDDGVPEVAIGRLPVRTLAEFQALSDKLLAVDGSNPGRRLLLVAGGSDEASDFKAISEDFAARLPGVWQSNRAYVDDLGVSAANHAVLAQLNSGAGLVSYVGHSAPIQWSSEDQALLSAGEVGALTGAVSDLIVQWGCWNSYFVSPRADTMAHAFLLPDHHGAAAVIGVSTLTEVEAHQALGDVLYPRLLPGTRIGDALLAAKQALAGQSGIIRDILLASMLLGDPAMPIR